MEVVGSSPIETTKNWYKDPYKVSGDYGDVVLTVRSVLS